MAVLNRPRCSCEKAIHPGQKSVSRRREHETIIASKSGRAETLLALAILLRGGLNRKTTLKPACCMQTYQVKQPNRPRNLKWDGVANPRSMSIPGRLAFSFFCHRGFFFTPTKWRALTFGPASRRIRRYPSPFGRHG